MVQNTGRPGYLQIADDLREQIRSGALSPGDPLPSTAQLAERYDASVGTAKTAVSTLRGEGLVIGQQGKGVFVRDSVEPAPATGTDALDVIRAELRELSDRVAQVEQALADSKQRPGGRSSR